MRRISTWSVVSLLVVAVTALGAGGWHFSDELLHAPQVAEPVFEVAVLEVDEASGTIALADPDGDLLDLGHLGFRTPEGLLLLGDEVARDEASIVRRGDLLDGEWPARGDHGAPLVDTFAGDPAETLGLPFDTVEVASALGPLPAWRVVPSGSARDGTWVVIVHGRGADRAEGNRALAVAARAGLPALSISVRNDAGAPADPDGFGRFGDVEWEDLQAAIDHLQKVEGAERFVLVGYSQGASLVLTFLRRSPDVSHVPGAVLVSPLVSMDATLALQAEERGVPSVFVPALVRSTKWIASARSGIRFDRLEHVEAAHELPAIPMLVTHGTEDRTTPVDATREFAAALDGQATYLEYEGAGHVREWNVDRSGFEAALETFLSDTAP